MTNTSKSKTELAYELISQAPITSGVLAQALGISTREAGWIASRLCANGRAVRMRRGHRGHAAIYGPVGSMEHADSIPEKVKDVILASNVMLSAHAIARVIHAKADTVRSTCLRMAEDGLIHAVRHGKFTFFCQDLDCTDPVETRPNPNPTGKTRVSSAPRKKPLVLRPVVQEQKAVPAPPPKPIGIGSTQYGAYIGSAKNPRAPWLDMSAWDEPSIVRTQKVGFSDNGIGGAP
ncbi:MAG: hypothetical protein ACYCY2_02375 [Acidithiobacillus ferriphilus]